MLLSVMETEHSVPTSIRGVLHWVTQSLRNLYGSRLRHLFLFGSYARGEARPDSDVDLLIVLDGPVKPLEEARRTSPVVLRSASYRDTALSFVHLSAEEFNDDRRPLVQSVRQEGIDLLKTPFGEPVSFSQEAS